jgi:hypothetical protein
MALTQDERIAISKKIVKIPFEDAQSTLIQGQLEASKLIAQAEDSANKTLMDQRTSLINAYQSEVQKYNGTGRTQLTEQNIIDSANKIAQNSFFPNDPQVTMPNIPDGVWKNFAAFSGNRAIGKNYNESYSSVTNEQFLFSSINAQIATIESYTDVTRSTGQECVPTDTIQPHPGMQAAASAVISDVQNWENTLNAAYAAIPSAIADPDPTRVAQNDAARQDITDALVIINTWQALATFDTTHGTSTCAAFNSIDVNTLNPTKFRAAELQPLKDEIAARGVFLTTRIGQVDTTLGGVNQNFTTGEIVSTTGFYGERFRFIDMRLNLMGGSLSKLIGIQRGQDAQEEAKQANANASAALSSVIEATIFTAPGTGNPNIHVKDIGSFSVSDNVYVVADKQLEISATIVDINGNRVTLDTKVPKKYRETDFARLYKVL